MVEGGLVGGAGVRAGDCFIPLEGPGLLGVPQLRAVDRPGVTKGDRIMEPPVHRRSIRYFQRDGALASGFVLLTKSV